MYIWNKEERLVSNFCCLVQTYLCYCYCLLWPTYETLSIYTSFRNGIKGHTMWHMLQNMRPRIYMYVLYYFGFPKNW